MNRKLRLLMIAKSEVEMHSSSGMNNHVLACCSCYCLRKQCSKIRNKTGFTCAFVYQFKKSEQHSSGLERLTFDPHLISSFRKEKKQKGSIFPFIHWQSFFIFDRHNLLRFILIITLIIIILIINI